MRVALFDLSPYTMGGDRTWCDNVRYGLEQRGDEVTYLRSNLLKSTRNVTPYVWSGDLVGYDAVIFSDVYADQTHTDVNLYSLLEKLRNRDVMTVLGLHGNLKQQRSEERRRDAAACLELASHPWVTNLRMLTEASEYVTDALLERVRVMSRVPYRPAVYPHWDDWSADTWERRRGLLITGRISAPKGQRVLVNLADRLDVPLTISGKGQFKSAVHLLEDVLKLGGKLDGPEPTTYAAPWSAVTKNGTPVRYTGGYKDAIDEVPWHRATGHVNLTAAACSVGHLEYSTLEALDNGLSVGVPIHAALADFNMTYVNLQTNGFMTHREFTKETEANLAPFVEALQSLGHRRVNSLDEVRRCLARHDPVVYVDELLR